MDIKVVSGDIAAFKADAVIVNLFEGVTSPAGGTGAVDKVLDGLITDEITRENGFTGKLGDTLVLNTMGKISARYVVIVGLGKSEKATSYQYRRAAAAAIQACKKLKVKTVATILHGAGTGGYDVTSAARNLAEGSVLGNYSFDLRKSVDPENPPVNIETLTVVEQDDSKRKAIETGLTIGAVIAKNTNLARDYVNDSPNYVTPTFLKEEAEKTPNLECTILDFKAIKALKMEMFELVAKGSDHPPYLIHLKYKPSGKAKKVVALVGKGLTFDSGGLSLKPAKNMETMKLDMGGAAAVLGTMKAIAELGDLDIEVHGFIGTCENMPSGRSSKPGDIVTSMKGKTVEVNNTDAEGRLVLGDVIYYAQQQTNPDELIDLATLTGAQVVALGTAAAAIMGTGQPLIDGIRAACEHSGEKMWQLPFYEEYNEFLKSPFADLINGGSQGQAGSQNGGLFIGNFVDENRAWAHIDIAGPAYNSHPVPEVPKNGTGFGVRTLLYYLYGWQ